MIEPALYPPNIQFTRLNLKIPTNPQLIPPIAKIMNAKAELDRKKIADPKKFTDQEYEAELAKIRDGNVNGEKIPTLTIIIKATDNSSYKNLVDALDEMQICTIGKYVIDKITPEDEGLLKKKGVK